MSTVVPEEGSLPPQAAPPDLDDVGDATDAVAEAGAEANDEGGEREASYEPCPGCGAEHPPGASYCEECGRDLGQQPAAELLPDPPAAPAALCASCGEGHYLDGYCDVCGAKEVDPRDHYEESPAAWLAGVCDIGLRHHRNEDAIALHAAAEPLSFGVLVVCDGVSNSTDSHIASLAAARAARDLLESPVSRGMGTRTAIVATVEQRLAAAVEAAQSAVVATTADAHVPSPPSCTFVAALVVDRIAVVGVVGDSRAYWVPDDPDVAARQLGRDDSFAAELIASGIAREEAEAGPNAHAITRWLGFDSPDDLTPHTEDLDLDRDGWLLLCSDGLWNYVSEAGQLQALVHRTVTELGPQGHDLLALARALTGFARDCGGIDNISVTLARVAAAAPAHTLTSATSVAAAPTFSDVARSESLAAPDTDDNDDDDDDKENP